MLVHICCVHSASLCCSALLSNIACDQLSGGVFLGLTPFGPKRVCLCERASEPIACVRVSVAVYALHGGPGEDVGGGGELLRARGG